mgnify:CR=1 FL=1
MNPSLKLNSIWTFYYTSRKEEDCKIPYQERITKLAEFSNLEDFLKYYMKIKPINEIGHNCDISLFKQGYQPLWESCPDCGFWLYRFKRTDDMKLIHKQWEKIILSLVSEKFNVPHILGAVLSIRSRETIIEIWFNYFNRDSIKTSVLEQFKSLFKDKSDESIFYFKDVKQSLNEGSTLRNIEAHLSKGDKSKK